MESTLQVGDSVTYWQPWPEDEVPDHPTATGTILAIHRSDRGFLWLEVSGRDRMVSVERVITVERREAVAA